MSRRQTGGPAAGSGPVVHEGAKPFVGVGRASRDTDRHRAAPEALANVRVSLATHVGDDTRGGASRLTEAASCIGHKNWTGSN